MNEIKETKGGISVATEHIFPVIKKWLYSEKEIFLREIVSNACDAITKLKRLDALGQYDGNGEEYKIEVKFNKEEKTLIVSDNGIGMNLEEIEKYICSIALSGALDFIEKYEGEEKNNGIIGHFGLGFYSSFMVASTVDVITRSIDGSATVKWSCTDGGDYRILAAEERECHGTDIIMHINEEGEEYLDKYKLEEILGKYCQFMPVEIYLIDENKEDDGEEENKDDIKPINNTQPLWLKNPSDCTDEDYKKFYSEVFHDWKEPLFHIHINADYPLNFKGILYFPKIANEYESLEGQVKLYYNQVFVADNIKEVIPEYLLMLKGVLDCPELPLNVSRSYLQNSGYVSKISSHIVKKTADKINGMFNLERENFEKIYRDLKIFIEYGSMKDKKFFDRIKKSLLLELTDGSFLTVDEYLEKVKEKCEGKVYYATDKVTQSRYISLLNDEQIPVVLLDRFIDTQFIGLIEGDKNIKFLRCDADISDFLKSEGEAYQNDATVELFKSVAGNDKLKVTFENLKDSSLPAVMTVSEESRRMADMMKMYGMPDMPDMPEDATLVLNSSNNVIKKLANDSPDEVKRAAAEQIYSLAILSQRQLTPEELKRFFDSSVKLIEKTL